MRYLYVLVPLFALLIGALAFLIAVWVHVADVQIPAYGWIAIIGGVLFTLLIGGGLMALVFYSSRKGYDEQAHHFDKYH